MSLLPDFLKGLEDLKKGKFPDPACKPVPPRDPPPVRSPDPFCTTGPDAGSLLKILKTLGRR